MTRTLICVAVLLGALAVAGTASAQYYPPPYTIPPTTGYYYPVQPGGFVTGNPTPIPAPYYPPAPVYDPNRPVMGSSSANMTWDPYRGWVTNTQATNVLNSAFSPGRGPMPGTAIQNYNYWNGAQWVQGQRWLGQDGQWHGTNTDTTMNPTGGASSNTTVYSIQERRNPDGTTTQQRTSRQVPR